MKKIFKFAAILTVAAFTLSTVASCSKDDKDEKKEDVDPTPEPEPEPEPTDPVPVEGNSDWSVIGSLLGKSWDTDFVCAEQNGAFVVKNVKLTTSDEIKFRFQKGWDVNRGINEPNVAAVIATGVPTKAVPNGGNIKVSEDGVYDLYYFADLECITFVKKGETPKSEDFNEGPVAQSWDYVMNISDYKTNSEFHFGTATKFNPNSLTFQWKFFPTKWNDYDKVDEERGYKVWCNRLGQIGTSQEKGILFRFNDGGEKGQLRLGSAIYGTNDLYLAKDGAAYLWSLNEWHTLTITSDGTTVSVYDNNTLITSFAQATPEVFAEWAVERFDISMTWDDGTGYDKGQAFLGYIAYTRVWSKALSAEEVAASLCDVTDNNGLEICWNWNLDEGHTVANAGKAAGYDLDFTTALAGGQQSYVKAEDIEGTWTPVEDIENGAVCAE